MLLNTASKKWLNSRFKKNVKFDEPMAAHTSFRVGGPAAGYVVPENQQDLFELVMWLKERKYPYLIIGAGTNLLVEDEGLPGIVIGLQRCLKRILIKDKDNDTVVVKAMAGAKLGQLCSFALKHGLEGMNFALGIPGTVGGGIMMNAGTAYGWIEGVLDAVTVLFPAGKMASISREKLDFSYRTLSWEKENPSHNLGRPIIIDGLFNLYPADSQKLKEEAKTILITRKKKQPTSQPSAGCFFKNPVSGRTAGELIEKAGLKGRRIGGAKVSTKHANFIINTGQATAADILALMELIQDAVLTKFNIQLDTEVKIVGKETYSEKLF
jgi:UDP-N-acetylmuramate dehydrogenase